jgi:hypothetical protein
VSRSNPCRSLFATCFIHPPDLSWIPILFPLLIRTHMFTTRSVSSTGQIAFSGSSPAVFHLTRAPGKILRLSLHAQHDGIFD